MIDIHGVGPIWWARVTPEHTERTLWFREVDPPYRRGRGVRVRRTVFGVCRRDRSGEDDRSALDGRDFYVPVEELRDWKGPKRGTEEEAQDEVEVAADGPQPSEQDDHRRPDPVG